MILLTTREYRFNRGILDRSPAPFVDGPAARARIADLNEILLSFDAFILREAERASAELEARLTALEPTMNDFDIEVIARFSLRDDDPSYDDGEDMTITELCGDARFTDQREGLDQGHMRGLARPIDARPHRPRLRTTEGDGDRVEGTPVTAQVRDDKRRGQPVGPSQFLGRERERRRTKVGLEHATHLPILVRA